MRDSIKDEQYFDEYITQQENRISKFCHKLQSGEVEEDRVIPITKKINDLRFSVFEAKYSQGEDLDILRKEFSNIVFSMPQFHKPTHVYVDMLWMLSIAVMLEVDSDEWDALSALILASNVNDWLLGYLLSSRGGNCQYRNWQIKMENPYDYLRNIIENSTNKERDLKNYLENKWYKAHNEMAWYEIHNHNEKLYSGYWSYESGAISKILGINDESMKCVAYYPYDMAHYKKHS